MNLLAFVDRAKHSAFHLWILNQGLKRMIPFNKPHGFKITSVGASQVAILLPYKKRNFNHIRGLHACALATVSEYATGFLLICKLDPKKYRLIMQRLEMDYHYQGKMDAMATFSLSDEWLATHIFNPLKTNESVTVVCEININDVKGNHLTTGKIHWQIKDWQRVKTT